MNTIVSAGVTIDSSAHIILADSGSTLLPLGSVFTVISNTATPITGTFDNLPDGGTITVGSNTFQANYEGGDGNDLALTVQPRNETRITNEKQGQPIRCDSHNLHQPTSLCRQRDLETSPHQ